ncbi:MAG TPA: NUDIX domain-containing protein [Anaerolineales bacterium]
MMLIRDGQVLLIRHSYLRGWYLPGGGLKRGESMEAAARREAREESGAEAGPLTLMGVYSRLERIKSDHNVLFLCTEFEWDGRHDAEIAEVRLFPLTALPEGTHSGHRRRIEQYARGESVPSSGLW